MTCAHIAAKNGSEAVIKLLMSFNKSLVTSVRNQVTEALPLHLAVSGSHEHVVRLLIDAGSSPIAENQEGMTAIHMVPAWFQDGAPTHVSFSHFFRLPEKEIWRFCKQLLQVRRVDRLKRTV